MYAELWLIITLKKLRTHLMFNAAMAMVHLKDLKVTFLQHYGCPYLSTRLSFSPHLFLAPPTVVQVGRRLVADNGLKSVGDAGFVGVTSSGQRRACLGVVMAGTGASEMRGSTDGDLSDGGSTSGDLDGDGSGTRFFGGGVGWLGFQDYRVL